MKIVDISLNNAYLHLYRGFLEIKLPNEEIKRTPIDDIECLIVSGNGISYSHNLIQRLCRENIPLVICGKNFQPCGMLLNVVGNYEQMGRLKNQIAMSKPLQKRIWQKVIMEKVRNQAKVLQQYNLKANDLIEMSNKVKSGDTSNHEAIAARKYWQRLFGETFRRDYEKPGINSFLNFGYAILRSSLCRYIAGSGLNASLGLHHHNRLNPWCLADDLMEPYRPFIDLKVKQISDAEEEKLTPQIKRELSSIFEIKYDLQECSSPLKLCIRNTVLTLWKSIKDKNCLVEYPGFDTQRI